MSDISKLTELRKLMLDMESSMGLRELSTVERDVYYAASDFPDTSDGVRTNTIRAHAIVASMSRPTFFRALKSLVGKGYLEQSGSASRGRYLVKAPK